MNFGHKETCWPNVVSSTKIEFAVSQEDTAQRKEIIGESVWAKK